MLSSFIRYALRLAALVMICIVAGFALLFLVNCLPGESIARHVRFSAVTMEKEGSYPTQKTINGIEQSDRFSDSIMLTEAAFDDGRSVFEHTLRTPYFLIENKDPYGSFIQYYTEENVESAEPIIIDYARYWHGYLVYLRPLLMFFHLEQICTVYFIIQAALCAWMIVLMFRRHVAQFVPAFLLTIALLSPSVIARSLQFSSVYFVGLAASCVLLLFSKQLKRVSAAGLFFAVIGCLTSYLDLLTAPLMTLYFPLSLYFCLNPGTVKKNVLRLGALCSCWAVGYGGMWAGKWALASLFLGENVIADAMEAANRRTDFMSGVDSFSYAQMVRKIWDWAESPLYIAVFALIGICVILIVHKRILGRLPASMAAFIPVALLPFAWFFVFANHTYVHSFFVNRAFGAVPLGLMCAFIAPIARQRSGSRSSLTDP